MPKKWPNLESLLKNEGKAISWRGSNGKIFHLALGNTSNSPQKGAIYNCCLAVCGPRCLSVCLFAPSTSSLPRVLCLSCLDNALSREGSVSTGTRGKDAHVSPLLLQSGSVGFSELQCRKQVENYAPRQTVFFLPPSAQSIEAFEPLALRQQQTHTGRGKGPLNDM